MRPGYMIGNKNCIHKRISKKLDRCIRNMQRELIKKNKTKYKVSYVLASDELARRLLK